LLSSRSVQPSIGMILLVWLRISTYSSIGFVSGAYSMSIMNTPGTNVAVRVGVLVCVAVGRVPVMVGVRVAVAVMVIVPVEVCVGVEDGVGVSVLSFRGTNGR